MGMRKKLARARTARVKGCKKCVWFHRLMLNEHDESTLGSCQVGAPRATAERKWPHVHENAWCGEFMPLKGEDDRGLWMNNGEEE